LLTNRFYGLCDAIEGKYGVYINPTMELPWLKRQYLHRNRFYHDIRHIMLTLELYDIIKSEIHEVEKRMAMQFALIYHDIIYMSERGDDFNIQLSIDAALYSLSDDRVSKFAKLVEEYIMATHHTMFIDDENTRNHFSIEAKYISDMDLYAFALPYEQVYENTQNVRKEFSHLTDDEFSHGQKKFLEKMLKLKNIYLTKFFGKFEKTARKNIESLILSYE
jgi:predicted metal-dependent HD superfamily phosphohydrolase